MYNYEKEKHKIFTENGMHMYITIKENVKNLINSAGAFQLEKALSEVCGDSWTQLACIDYLIEQGEIKKVYTGDSTQRHVLISAN